MRKKIAKLMELPKGATKRFTFKREGVLIDAFVANFNGDIVAYENLCRHLPITLDYGCLLYTSPSPRDATLSRMPSSA